MHSPCLSTLFAGVITIAAATAQRADSPSDLQLFLQAGAKAGQHNLLSDVLGSMRKLGRHDDEDLARVLAQLRQIKPEHLPVTVRVYVPGDWDRELHEEPPTYLTVLDAGAELPVEDWLAHSVGAKPGGASASALFLRTAKVQGGHRYLFGKGWPELEAQVMPIERGRLPATHRAIERLRRKVTDHSAYLVLDARSVASVDDLGEMQALGGKHASLFAVALGRDGKRWNVDLHWGARPGEGMLGAMLPKSASRPRLAELMPWEPGVAFQANLGSDLAATIQRMGLSRQIPDPDVRVLVDRLLESWEGEIGFFQPQPPRGYSAHALAPLPMQLASEFAWVLRVDDGDELLDEFAQSLGRMATRTRDGILRLDGRGNSVHFGHRDGVIAGYRADDPETASANLSKILAAAGKRHTPRRGMQLDGPIQAWLSAEAGKRFTEILGDQPSQRGNPGYEFGRALGQRLVSGGFGVSITWDRDGMRLRFEF